MIINEIKEGKSKENDVYPYFYFLVIDGSFSIVVHLALVDFLWIYSKKMFSKKSSGKCVILCGLNL